MHISKDAGVSLVLRIDNTLPLVEKANSEATEVACTLIKSIAIRDRTGNIDSFAFQKPKTSKPATHRAKLVIGFPEYDLDEEAALVD
ncbi:hypothetical protein Tco_0761967 [Tanacetum coccineum]